MLGEGNLSKSISQGSKKKANRNDALLSIVDLCAATNGGKID
jgi:hypothetical protein